MKRVLVSMAASLLLVLALVVPVAAADGRGCSAFGDASGKGPGFGPFVASYATQGPGTISGIVAWEHSTMCTHP